MKKTIGLILLESVFIVFSVFIGFALERYRESRVEEEQKIKLYKELKVDIENMLRADVKRIANRYESLEISFAYLITALTTGAHDPHKLIVAVQDFEYFPRIIGQRPTYHSIINSGSITLFEHDSTFKKIQELYDRIDLINQVAADDHYYKTYLTPFLNKYSDRSALGFDLERNNLFTVKSPDIELKSFKTKEFSNILYLLKFRLDLYNDNKFILDKSREILREIDELTKSE